MERLLRRWMWVLDGAAIAVAAIFAAHAAARWISRVEIHGLPQHLIEDYVASSEETPAKKIDAILGRHIFCSACDASGPKPSSWLVLERLPLRLIAVMYAARPVDWRWSVAIIRDDTAKATQPFIVGSPIRDATIHAIEATRVHLRRRDGQREVLELLEPAPRPAVGAQAASGSRTGGATPSFRDGIRQLGDGRYEIQRRTLEAWTGNLPQLAGEVRVAPVLLDGKSTGLRLDGIRSDGPLAAIGLRSGDVIRAINGLDLDAPERALDAYLKLRAASHVSIAADRAGRRIQLDYDVR
jgi:general secretion pathway protein C